MSPEMHPKSFGTFEKRAPDPIEDLHDHGAKSEKGKASSPTPKGADIENGAFGLLWTAVQSFDYHLLPTSAN